MSETIELKTDCSAFHTSLLSLQQRQLLCDVTIEDDDGDSIKAHSCVLAACSPVLNGLLCQESGPLTLSCSGISITTWELALEFMYTHHLPLDPNEAKTEQWQSLYNAATYLQLTALIELLDLNTVLLLPHNLDHFVSEDMEMTINVTSNNLEDTESQGLKLKLESLLPQTINKRKRKTNRPMKQPTKKVRKVTKGTPMKKALRCRFCRLKFVNRMSLMNHVSKYCVKIHGHRSLLQESIKSEGEEEDDDDLYPSEDDFAEDMYEPESVPEDSDEDYEENPKSSLSKQKPRIGVSKMKGKSRRARKPKMKKEEVTPPKKKEVLLTCVDEKCNATFTSNEEYNKHSTLCLTGGDYVDPATLLEKKDNTYTLIFDHEQQPPADATDVIMFPSFTLTRGTSFKGRRKNAKSYKCSHCSLSGIVGIQRMINHVMNVHRKVKPYKCRECQRRVCGLAELRYHFQRFHNTVPKYPCSGCDQVFMCDDTLKAHFRHEHTRTDEKGLAIRKYKCQWCDKSFKLSHHRRRHEMFHLRPEDRPLKCDYCEKRFVARHDLINHIKVHTGERPYKCKYCSYSAAKVQSLRLHERGTHKISNKNYKCLTCGKMFVRIGTFRDHLIQENHSGEKIVRDQNETPVIVERKERRVPTAKKKPVEENITIQTFTYEQIPEADQTYTETLEVTDAGDLTASTVELSYPTSVAEYQTPQITMTHPIDKTIETTVRNIVSGGQSILPMNQTLTMGTSGGNQQYYSYADTSLQQQGGMIASQSEQLPNVVFEYQTAKPMNTVNTGGQHLTQVSRMPVEKIDSFHNAGQIPSFVAQPNTSMETTTWGRYKIHTVKMVNQ